MDARASRSSYAAAMSKIERVPLREVWPHEAYDLTTWLEKNVDVLNDVPESQPRIGRARAYGRRRSASTSSLRMRRGARS